MNNAVARPGHGFRLAMVVVAGVWLAATPQVEATILLHESFGFNANGIRRDSGGAPKVVGIGIDLGGTQIEFPTNTVAWQTHGGHQAQTWKVLVRAILPRDRLARSTRNHVYVGQEFDPLRRDDWISASPNARRGGGTAECALQMRDPATQGSARWNHQECDLEGHPASDQGLWTFFSFFRESTGVLMHPISMARESQL